MVRDKEWQRYALECSAIRTRQALIDERQRAVSGNATPQTTQLSGQALCCRRQQEASDNALDHSAIRAGPSDERQRAASGNATP